MSPTSSNVVQPQWDLSHTSFKSLHAIRDLMLNASKDDASGQAVYALEQLGTNMLVNKELIAQGYDALGQGGFSFLKVVQLTVGLTGDGVAREFRKSRGCIACFVFITGCKICYSTSEIANIIFEALDITGVLNRIPTSPYQLTRIVDMLSGYSDIFCPVDVFQELGERMLIHVPHKNMTSKMWMEELMTPSDIAKIIMEVFRAVQDDEVSRITLEGSRNSIWLATFLSWILPIGVNVSSIPPKPYTDPRNPTKLILGDPAARLQFYITNDIQSDWKIQEWKAEQTLSTVIKPEGSYLRDPKRNHHGSPKVLPLQSTRLSLICAWSEEISYNIGNLIGSLLEISVERGQLFFLGGPKDHKSSINFSSICQLHFLSEYRGILKHYGWEVDDRFLADQKEMTTLIWDAIFDVSSKNFDEELFKNSQDTSYSLIPFLDAIFAKSRWRSTSTLGNRLDIVQPAVVLTREIILSSFLTKLPKLRPQWLLDQWVTQRSGQFLCQLILGGRLPRIERLKLSACLTDAFQNAMFQSTVKINERHLVFTSNGYVIYLSAIEQQSMDCREACSITVIPGSLRWGSSMTPFLMLEDYEHHGVASGPEPLVTFFTFSPFSSKHYTGLELPTDPHGYKIESTITAFEHTLVSATYFCSNWNKRKPMRMLWSSCIQAIATAHRITGPPPTTSAETAIAVEMERQGIFKSILGGSLEIVPQSHYRGLVTCTANDDIARFFAGGRYHRVADVLVIREDAALIQCISKCIQLTDDFGEASEKSWIVIA
ncbi:hypothetical protein MMC10_008556 [Thelotrema lepadinum]|nr:hypothetical protein [Thelotrema lepadinum]